MPSETTLKAAQMANPDGLGFASPNHYYRGLSYKAFKHELRKVSIDEPCIIHFRLATHGSVKKSNCHPFCRGGVYFAHNGILDIPAMRDMTDSETAFQKYIAPAIENYGFDSDEAVYTIEALRGYSKFALLKDGELRLYGDFISDADGCLYSNFRFKALLPLVQRGIYSRHNRCYI